MTTNGACAPWNLSTVPTRTPSSRDRYPGCLQHHPPAEPAAFAVTKSVDGFDNTGSSIGPATFNYRLPAAS